tara:strand:+ start:2986 stop:3612 length:627 start_codon:yes stop_codon:yes gene_type:complete
MATQYADKTELKAYIGLSGSGQDDNIDNALDGASRQIDKITGRRFYQDSSAQVKTYTPNNEFILDVDDISTTTGLIVKLDDNDDGTFETTLTINTDFIVEPVNPDIIKITGGTTYTAPFTQLRILNTRSSERFDPSIVNNVQVTAKFGYSFIPEPIKQATLIQGLRLFKRKDAPFNILGNEQTGQIELFNKFDPDARELIKGYIKNKL